MGAHCACAVKIPPSLAILRVISPPRCLFCPLVMERDAQSQPATSSSSSSSSSAAASAAAKLKYAFRPGDNRRRRDRKRAKARVNLGGALPRWRKLRERLGLQRDADLARLLLDSCQRGSAAPASSKSPETPLQSISSTAPSTDSQIDGKDPDDDDMWETASEDASSDEDCAPSISLRTGGGKKIEED